LAALDALAESLSETAAGARPLIAAMGASLSFAWLPATDPQLLDRLETLRPPSDVGLALGTVRDGIEGFRASHAEALEARRVVALRDRSLGWTTSYRRVEVAALCSRDPDRAADLVRRELGPLAADDDATRRLRATLRAYTASGANFRAAARQLGLHHNTVIYRVRRAQELLGGGADIHRLEFQLALGLADGAPGLVHVIVHKSDQPGGVEGEE
jgi:DNA-binding PucR family transcriptional regulator